MRPGARLKQAAGGGRAPGKADLVNSIRRAGLATLIALAICMTASVASAIEYDDVIGLTRQGVSDLYQHSRYRHRTGYDAAGE